MPVNFHKEGPRAYICNLIVFLYYTTGTETAH